MEIKFVETARIKEKFALLITKLHRAGLLTDYINATIVQSSFFDCFENNDLDDFLTRSLEGITKDIFRKEVFYDYSHDDVDEYYWAGLSIMDVLLNLEVPLKRILSVMPLSEVVAAFEPFHEMHPEQFLNHYKKVERGRSLLKTLRNNKGLSIADISYLTGIKAPLLRLFDRSNDSLFGTSFSNLNKLAGLFTISSDVFKKKSSFVAFSIDLLQNDAFQSILVRGILGYFHIQEDTRYEVLNRYVDEKEIRKHLSEDIVLMDLSNPFGVLYKSSNRVYRKYLSNEEFACIYQASIEKLRLQANELLF